MKEYNLNDFPRLIEDYHKYLVDHPSLTYREHCEKIYERYGVTPVVDSLGSSAIVEMSDEEALMFTLRWS